MLSMRLSPILSSSSGDKTEGFAEVPKLNGVSKSKNI